MSIRSPLISVIITAFNRKEYILDALRSVVNQSLQRDFYEIIVVKNFLDSETDEFIKANKCISIDDMGGNIGDQLSAGIMASSGQVICFLDDDDAFHSGKLESVRKNLKATQDWCTITILLHFSLGV